LDDNNDDLKKVIDEYVLGCELNPEKIRVYSEDEVYNNLSKSSQSRYKKNTLSEQTIVKTANEKCENLFIYGNNDEEQDIVF